MYKMIRFTAEDYKNAEVHTIIVNHTKKISQFYG